MQSIKGTQTEKNLLAAFAGESQAAARYSFFAKKAKKDGYEQIMGIFTETSENELVHAKTFFSFLEGGDVEIQAVFPAGTIGTTLENLTASARGEHEEHTVLYPEFARIAEEEGFKNIATAFRMIARVEEAHEIRFKRLADSIEKGEFFSKEESHRWKCIKCGYVHEGKSAPDKCPACGHPQGHFELNPENY